MPDIDFSMFASLSGKKLENALKTAGAGFFRELSGSEYLRQLRASGGAIRDSTFFALRRETLGLAKHEERILSLSAGTPIPETFINRDHRFKIQQDYLYRFKANYISEKTNEKINTFTSYISNERLTNEQALSAVRAQIEISPEENDSLQLEFSVNSITYVLGRN